MTGLMILVEGDCGDFMNCLYNIIDCLMKFANVSSCDFFICIDVILLFYRSSKMLA